MQNMITHKIQILPNISKPKEKRLTLDRKQSKNTNYPSHSINNSGSNNGSSKIQQTEQKLTFHVRRPQRNLFKDRSIAQNLIMQTNHPIRQRPPQINNNSLLALLMGPQFVERSAFSTEKPMRLMEKNIKFIANESLKLTEEIKLHQQKSSSYVQKFNFKQPSMIRNYNQCSKNLIQQSSQKSQLSKSLQIINQPEQTPPKVKKQYVSIGISTDFEMGVQSYNQFLKFKIMQKQKFNQLQNLFIKIDSICIKDQKIFDQRHQKIRKLYQTALQTKRQKTTDQIIKSKDKVNNEIFELIDLTMEEFKDAKREICRQNSAKIKRIHEEISTVSFRIPSDISKSGEFISKIQNSIKSVFSQEKNQNKENTIQSEFDKKITIITELLRDYEEKTGNYLDELTENLVKRIKKIKKKFKEWKTLISQKDFMLGLCIEDVIKLPQMSMTIFGMGEESDNKENEALKKIGVFLEDIPDFGNFCQKNVQLNNVQKKLGKLLDLKCINCSYLKSKMRFIEGKNNELQPVIKILKSLIKGQTQNIY